MAEKKLVSNRSRAAGICSKNRRYSSDPKAMANFISELNQIFSLLNQQWLFIQDIFELIDRTLLLRPVDTKNYIAVLCSAQRIFWRRSVEVEQSLWQLHRSLLDVTEFGKCSEPFIKTPNFSRDCLNYRHDRNARSSRHSRNCENDCRTDPAKRKHIGCSAYLRVIFFTCVLVDQGLFNSIHATPHCWRLSVDLIYV